MLKDKSIVITGGGSGIGAAAAVAAARYATHETCARVGVDGGLKA